MPDGKGQKGFRRGIREGGLVSPEESARKGEAQKKKLFETEAQKQRKQQIGFSPRANIGGIFGGFAPVEQLWEPYPGAGRDFQRIHGETPQSFYSGVYPNFDPIEAWKQETNFAIQNWQQTGFPPSPAAWDMFRQQFLSFGGMGAQVSGGSGGGRQQFVLNQPTKMLAGERGPERITAESLVPGQQPGIIVESPELPTTRPKPTTREEQFIQQALKYGKFTPGGFQGGGIPLGAAQFGPTPQVGPVIVKSTTGQARNAPVRTKRPWSPGKEKFEFIPDGGGGGGGPEPNPFEVITAPMWRWQVDLLNQFMTGQGVLPTVPAASRPFPELGRIPEGIRKRLEERLAGRSIEELARPFISGVAARGVGG